MTVGLSEMASYDQYANPVDEVNMPWELRFESDVHFPGTVEEGYTTF